MDLVINYTLSGTITVPIQEQLKPNMPIDTQLADMASIAIKNTPSHDLIKGVIQSPNKGKETVYVTKVKHVYDDGKMIGIAL